MWGASHARQRREGVDRALLALLVLSALGCGGTIRPSGRLDRARFASACARVPDAVRAARYDTGASEITLPPETSVEIRRVAEAARLDARAMADRTRQLERVLLLQAEVDAATSEVGCLDDQLEDLQAELEQRRDDFELMLTLSSIVVGALSGVIGGVLDLAEVDFQISASVQIAGGVGSAVLGVLALLPPGESIELEHERNVMRAVWDPDRAREGTVSRFVAELLQSPRGDGVSPRDFLRSRWAEAIEPLGEGGERLLLGDGGTYDLESLQARELALELLETQILLERQDLELLLRHLFQSDSAGSN